MIIFLLILFMTAILYLWWQVFKLKILIASIILQDKSKELVDEYMHDLNFKGGHNTERD